MDRFSAYDTSHLIVVVVLLLGALGLARVGRATRGSVTGDRIGKALALVILTLMVPVQLLYLSPRFLDLERTLPLQLCDLAWMVAAYALWMHRRWAVALTYYWGLTLTTQAVITPDLAAGFPDPAFWLFWTLHLLVIWAAVYLTWGLGLVPDWRSYRTALVVTGVWAVAMFGFNLVAGTNYGYLNSKPATASVLDLLGDWPWYILAEVVIVATVWALITWPWVARADDGRAGSSGGGRRTSHRWRAHGERSA